MLVNVIYDHGKIVWPDNMKPKDEKISIVVDIPDDQLNIKKIKEDISSLHPDVEKMMKELRRIRGDNYKYIPTSKTDKELFAEALEESGKYEI